MAFFGSCLYCVLLLTLLCTVRGLLLTGPQRVAIERVSKLLLAPSSKEPPFPETNAPLYCVLDRTTDVVNRVDGFKLQLPGWTRGMHQFDGMVVNAQRKGPTSIECDVPKVVSPLYQIQLTIS
mgnify:CR=1 FL=1